MTTWQRSSPSASTVDQEPIVRRTPSAGASTTTSIVNVAGRFRRRSRTKGGGSRAGSSRGPNPKPVGVGRGGQLAGPEPDAGVVGVLDTVEPEAAPVVPAQVVRDEVPAAADRDEPQRLDPALPPPPARGPGGGAEAGRR